MTASVAISITVSAPPPPPSGGPSATLAFADGSSLTFDQAQATDIGDYVGPFVRQRCLRQVLGPWVVDFRPDADGSRDEIVFEYGSLYDLSLVGTKAASGANPKVAGGYTPAEITQPYTATIHKNGAVVATISVPRHWWSSRWRWQSAPRPVVRSYADIVAMKAILPLSAQFVWNAQPPSTAFTWSGPMGTANLTLDMNTTGDRQEIGFITDRQACYLLTGNQVALTSIMAQAEAAGTFPFWKRDVSTGAPIDPKARPYLVQGTGDTYTGAYSRTLPHTSSGGSTPNYFNVTPSHFPAVSFVPWLLTDDPYFLEGCQMAALRAIQQTNYNPAADNLPGLVAISQERATGWGLRDLMRMAAFSPAAPPSWLLSKAQWQACVDDNLAYFTDQMQATPKFLAPHPAALVASPIQYTPGSSQAPFNAFELDYFLVTLGWADWSGLFPAWSPAICWLARPRLAMLGSEPGWDRRWPVPYGFATSCPLTKPTTWAAAWAWYQTTTTFNPPQSQWGTGVALTNRNYLSPCRAALAALRAAGVNDLGTYDWYAPQLPAIMAGTTYGDYKWAIS